MKILRTLSKVAILSVITAGAAHAGGAPGGSSGAWKNDYPGHYVNTANPDLRFDLATGRKAIPGRAAAAQAANGTSSDSDHNVISRPGSTLLDPGRTL